MKELLFSRAIILMCFAASLAFGMECSADDKSDYSKYRVSENTGMYAVSDIFNSKDKSRTKWNGCDPSKYRDMKFYDKDGKTLVRGIINGYSPENHGKTLGIRTKTLLNETHENIGTINPDGTFELEVGITHPHLCTFSFSEIYKDIYLSPGDTLDIVTTVNRSPVIHYRPEYLGFRGEFDDIVAINLLNDSIEKHYNLTLLWKNYPIRKGEEMKGDTYKANESLAGLLDSVVRDLPNLIGNLPVNGSVKDIVETLTAGDISYTAEYLDLNFHNANPNAFALDEEGNLIFKPGDQLDMKLKFAPWLRNMDLLYDNPLMLCTDFSILNGWRSNHLFKQGMNIACEIINPADSMTYGLEGISIYDQLKQADSENLRSIGVGNCFAAQYIRCLGLCNKISERGVPDSSHLEYNSYKVRNLLRHIDYDLLGEQLMSTFEDYIKDVLIAENKMNKEESKSKFIHDTGNVDTLKKLIDEYKGNVLFLDFWGIGCGPCLSGMKQHKPIIEEYSDHPFKVLYIAEDDASRKASERWLDKNDIKGEHIFITPDDWRRFSSIFDFSAIPFGVLIDKNGEVIALHYDILHDRKLLDDTLSAK